MITPNPLNQIKQKFLKNISLLYESKNILIWFLYNMYEYYLDFLHVKTILIYVTSIR